MPDCPYCASRVLGFGEEFRRCRQSLKEQFTTQAGGDLYVYKLGREFMTRLTFRVGNGVTGFKP